MPLSGEPTGASNAILFVDDEPLARKWFALNFGNEFAIQTAASVEDALAVLATRARDFSVLVTDYRMPVRDGLKLLQIAQREYKHLVRMLVTAYAEKEVAIAAVNQGSVFRILEKPLYDANVRQALRDAQEMSRERAHERALHEARITAMRESLGFLAHELNTPLATVRGCASAVLARHQPIGAELARGEASVHFVEQRTGEVLAALASIERRALFCQSLVSTFVQSARDAYPGARSNSLSASVLISDLLDEYPFEDEMRAWVSCHVIQDFELPAKRDLLYLVLSTLTKNALQALLGRENPQLRIEIGQTAPAESAESNWIRFVDNGPGIAPELLSRLSYEPLTTRAAVGGNGMGLVFCRRVMQSIHGDIAVQSPPGQGAVVTLRFGMQGAKPRDGVGTSHG
jgi:two-component system response regulator PhcR